MVAIALFAVATLGMVASLRHFTPASARLVQSHCLVQKQESSRFQPPPMTVSTGKNTCLVAQAALLRYSIQTTCGSFDGGDSSYRGTVIGHKYTITTVEDAVVGVREE